MQKYLKKEQYKKQPNTDTFTKIPAGLEKKLRDISNLGPHTQIPETSI